MDIRYMSGGDGWSETIIRTDRTRNHRVGHALVDKYVILHHDVHPGLGAIRCVYNQVGD